MKHVVLAYQREQAKLVLEESYDDIVSAMNRRFALEKLPEYAEMEIVVLSATSAETLRETHGRYFFGADHLLERLSQRLRPA